MIRNDITKKLIVIKPNGNKSNRLIQNVHFEAFCMEYNIEFQNSTFSDLTKYYSNPCNAQTNSFLKFLQIDLLGPVFHHSKFVKKVFSVVWIISLFGILKLVRFDRAKPNCLAILLNAFEKSDVVYVGGWAFRVPELVEKHRVEIQKKYTLKSSYFEGNALVDKTKKLKDEGYKLIGVHLRRGDYKTWKKGAYYYDDEIYKKQMESISGQLKQQGIEKVLFILFSNESIDFQQSANLFTSKEKWYIDHYIMSLSDYLIGPPSTFTLWASIIGNAKLFYLFNKDEKITI